MVHTIGGALITSADLRGLDLQSVHVEEPRLEKLYGAPLVRIRPGQIVGWRQFFPECSP